LNSIDITIHYITLR